MIKNKKPEQGFSLIELILSLAYFSFMLLFVTASFIQINRTYTRGVTIARVHNSGRNVIEEVSRKLRLASQDTPVVICDNGSGCSNDYRVCFSQVRYIWNNNPSVGDKKLLRSEDGQPCSSAVPSSAEVILEENVIAQNFSVTDKGSNVYRIDVTLSSGIGEDELLESTGKEAKCKGSVQAGSQFCDVVRLFTTVSLRN